MTESGESTQYLTAYVNGHYLGVPIHYIQDVIGPQPLTAVPLTRNAIAGVLNLRGRIVTVVDMHRRLHESQPENPTRCMGIIIEIHEELFSLRIDHVEDVIAIPHDHIEKAPPTLNPVWQSACAGVYQLDGKIMIILDIEQILNLDHMKAA